MEDLYGAEKEGENATSNKRVPTGMELSEEEAGTGLTDTSLGKVGEGLSSLLLLVKVMVTPRMTPTTRSRASAAQSQNLLSFLPNGENAAAWS